MRALTCVIVAAMVFSGGLGGPREAANAQSSGASMEAVEVTSERPVERVAGAGRVETAVEVSRSGWPDGADTALLATAADFPDALSAGALAAATGAPMLLSAGDRLHPEVASELTRLGAGRVVILGGENAVPGSIAIQVADLAHAPDVDRLAGTNRFDTAGLIAADAGAPAGEVVVTSGEAFPDALAAASLAASPQQLPALLVQRSTLPDPTAAVLAELTPDTAVIIGGRAAVDDGVADELAEAVGSVRRIAGDTRFATSKEVLLDALDRFDDEPRSLLVATGEVFADALAAGALAAELESPLLLVPHGELPAELDSVIRAHRERFFEGVVVGGTAAVSDRVLEQVHAALNPEEPPTDEAEWQLRTDGLGVVGFGQDFAEAHELLVEQFGEPSSDSGWQPMNVHSPDCPHDEERVVWWPGLHVAWGRGGVPADGPIPDGMTYWVADGTTGVSGPGLETINGFTVGHTNAQLRAAFPDVEIDARSDGTYWSTDYAEPDQADLHGTFWGVSAGPDDNATTVLMMSRVCGSMRAG